MILLGMVMTNILAQRTPQRALTKENESDKHSSFANLPSAPHRRSNVTGMRPPPRHREIRLRYSLA